MKLHYTSAFVIAGLLAALPVRADDTTASYGQTSSVDCFNAAGMVSRTGAALSDVLHKDAMASCTQALAGKMIAKDRIATLVNRGTIEAASGDLDAAIGDYKSAIALNPKLPDVYINRGSALMRATRYQEALADFNTALSLNPANAYIAYFNRGIAQEKLGNVQAAYQDYKQAASLAPDYQPAKTELARFQRVIRASGNG